MNIISDFNENLKKYDIYKTKFKNDIFFCVRENFDNNNQFGDCIFRKYEDAKFHADLMKSNEIKNKEFRKKQDDAVKFEELRKAEKAAKNRAKSRLIIDYDMINTYPKMKKGKIKNLLQKKIRFSDGGIYSWAELVESNKYIKTEIAEIPAVKWNRTKYNRMDNREQLEYEKRMKEKKTEYRLLTDDDMFLKIPKMLFDIIIKNENIY